MFFTLYRKIIETTRNCLCMSNLPEPVCECSMGAAGNVVYSIRIAENQKKIYIQFAGFMHTCRIPILMNDCTLHIIHIFQFFSYLSPTHKVPLNEVFELEYVSIATFSHFRKSHINRKINTSFKNRL